MSHGEIVNYYSFSNASKKPNIRPIINLTTYLSVVFRGNGGFAVPFSPKIWKEMNISGQGVKFIGTIM